MKKVFSWVLFLMAAAVSMAAANLPFINDDYAKAVSTAKQRNLPIFVEVWAPW